MANSGDKVGEYTLVRKVGEGGFGQIWEGVKRDEFGFEQRVAVKIVDPSILEDDEGKELFVREAIHAGSLRHPNIAAVLDVNHDQGYIVYELINGVNLADVLRNAPSQRIPYPLLVYVLTQLCRALSYAHNRVVHGKPSPVVHRDISPSNIVCDYEGNVVVIDFGISKDISSSKRSETVKGKLSYMAPEQATGQLVDGRTDQYALGVVAYESITGVRPNDGQHDGETLHNVLNGNHIPVTDRAPEMPAGIGKIIEQMLAVDPDDRFPTLEHVLDSLESFTPPVTIHRELAALVKKAGPRQTVVTEQGEFICREVKENDSPAMIKKSLQPDVTLQRWNRPIGSVPSNTSLPETEEFVYQNQEPQAAKVAPHKRVQIPAITSSEEFPIDFSFAGSYKKKLGGWTFSIIIAGISALVILITFLFYQSQSGKEIAPNDSYAVTPAPTTVASRTVSETKTSLTHLSSRSVPNVFGEQTSAPEQVIQKSNNHIQNTTTDRPSLLATSDLQKKRRNTSRSPSHRSSRKALADKSDKEVENKTVELKISIFPNGKAWVNGKRIQGTGPHYTTHLKPGKYTISGGRELPSIEKKVRLEMDSPQSLQFDLLTGEAQFIY